MVDKRQRGALTARVLDDRLWGGSPFVLLDVGSSGGIEHRWQAFGDRLEAVGFDPLVAEVERLNAANTHPGVRYEAAVVTCRDFDRLFPTALRNDRVASRNDEPFPRVSAAAAQDRLRNSYIQEQYNAGAPVALTTRSVTLDEYVPADRRAQVDFVKIDTDGHDIEVILGANAIMSAGGILGLYVETQFHGATHEFANTFSNIDRILRCHGFTLFDLSTYRYSRAHLPAPFVSDMAAQTTSGQVLWADALYLRDLGSTDYERMWPGYEVTSERVMKLACLFDLFELPDCAAELLVTRGQFLNAHQRGELLDTLATGEPGSYAAHVAAFDADFTAFYPSRLKSRPRLERGVSDTTIERLQAGMARLQGKNTALRGELNASREKVERLKDRLRRLEARRQ